jgi:hypothetical protein
MREMKVKGNMESSITFGNDHTKSACAAETMLIS